jgi:Zn-dependent protease with chaperone function
VTQSFNGQLHGPGRPDAGAPVRAEFVGGKLRIDGDYGVEPSRIRIEAGGFNQDDVVLNWQDAAGEFALMVIDAQAKQVLVATAPPALAPQLRRWTRSVNFTRRFWRTAFTVTAVVAVALGLGLWQYDQVIEWTANHVSPENERRLGRSVMDGVRREGKLVEESKALDAIREIGGRLTRDSTRKYEWHLKDDPSVNAFAVPGGFVVVHAGLVHAAETPEELAGVLAHEIEHVERRHTLQLMLYQLGWATILAVALGDPTAVTTLLLLQVGNLKFSRDLEAQADTGGLETLRKAGVAPDGMASFFKKLAAEGGGGPSWISTHPSTGDRVATIEAELKARPCTECQPLAMDWKAVRESLYADDLIRRPARKKK